MSLESIPELGKKLPMNFISVAAIIALVVVAFFAGSIYTTANMQDSNHTKEIQNLKDMISTYHQFALDEVGGLRNDMNREIVQVEDKLDRKVDK